MKILINDEQLSGVITHQFELVIETEVMTVQGLIEKRVAQEVQLYNESKPEFFRGLVEPCDGEKTLNGIKPKNRKLIDAKAQVHIALDAFQKNGFFILINNQQIDNLKQIVFLSPNTKISFVKLTPLVGG